ncbi:hypothetical protein DPB93_21625 [Salmonella enterica subsp. salamae]|nr:hypothetical protein [Salmonella enterica subsp. salamae]
MFCIRGEEVLAKPGGALMPVASLYCLLIGCGSIGVYVMPVASPFCLLVYGVLIGIYVIPLASKRIFAIYLYTKDT